MRVDCALLVLCLLCSGFSQSNTDNEYKLLATTKTSTMERELNEAADAGYQLVGTIGGDVGNGEIITILKKSLDAADKGRYGYKLLATSRTSTMQKELQEAADAGYEFKGETARGEVVIILELDRQAKNRPKYEYRLLATSKTSTMQKELNDASSQGFVFLCVIRRGEVMTILRRKVGG